MVTYVLVQPDPNIACFINRLWMTRSIPIIYGECAPACGFALIRAGSQPQAITTFTCRDGLASTPAPPRCVLIMASWDGQALIFGIDICSRMILAHIWYVLGYSPSSWSSLAGSLRKEKTRTCGRAMEWHAIWICSNALRNYSIISVSIVCIQTIWRARSGALVKTDTFPMLERMAPRRHPLRSWIVGMARRGELVSPAEGAIVASVPRQTVARWIREARIDLKAIRLCYLARHQLKAQRHAEGLPMMRKPSKGEMRRDLAKAMRRFNAANAKTH